MKNKIIINTIALLIISLIACKERDNYKKTKHITFSKEWKEDSLGCLGMRYKIVNNNIEYIKNCIGIDWLKFEELFGQPNEIDHGMHKITYIYAIGCYYAPYPKENSSDSNKIDFNRKNTENFIMLVDVQDDGLEKVSEIHFRLP